MILNYLEVLTVYLKSGAELQDFVPFRIENLMVFGEAEPRKNPDIKSSEKTIELNSEELEVTMIAWICAQFLGCLVRRRKARLLEDAKLFDLGSFDDVAYLLLLFEDSFSVWVEMAVADVEAGNTTVKASDQVGASRDVQDTSSLIEKPVEPDAAEIEENKPSEPPRKKQKKACRRDFRENKTYGKGNGLSSKEARGRYVAIRNRLGKHFNSPDMRSKLEERYKSQVEENRKWEIDNGLREKISGEDGDAKKTVEKHTVPCNDIQDEMTQQMLKAYGMMVEV